MAFSHVRSFYRGAIVNKFAETRSTIKSRNVSTVPVSIAPEQYQNNETRDEENNKECEDRGYWSRRKITPCSIAVFTSRSNVYEKGEKSNERGERKKSDR